MVIGKITSIGSLFLIGAVAILFLNQARQTSFGSAGQDVGLGLTGISGGISNLFSSFISPISGLFGSISSFFNLGEIPTQSNNRYGYVRPLPTQNTSRINSSTATNHTINTESSTGYTASSSDTGGGTISSGNFGATDTSSGWTGV